MAAVATSIVTFSKERIEDLCIPIFILFMFLSLLYVNTKEGVLGDLNTTLRSSSISFMNHFLVCTIFSNNILIGPV